MSNDTPRIYVACLAAYNNGKLHGKWIDATQDASDIRAEIDAMLKASPEVGAEEWAIHDCEGFGEIRIREFDGMARVSAIAQALEENDYPEVVSAALDHLSGDIDLKEIQEWISDHYRGSYRTLEDWAEEFLDETGDLNEIPEGLRPYFDFEKWARGAEYGGDIFTVEGGMGVLVFWNH